MQRFIFAPARSTQQCTRKSRCFAFLWRTSHPLRFSSHLAAYVWRWTSNLNWCEWQVRYARQESNICTPCQVPIDSLPLLSGVKRSISSCTTWNLRSSPLSSYLSFSLSLSLTLSLSGSKTINSAVCLDRHHRNRSTINRANGRIRAKFDQDERSKTNDINWSLIYWQLIQITKHRETTSLYRRERGRWKQHVWWWMFSVFRPQTFKHSEKVTIPQDDYPEVNFVGLIIGPRGSTLKNLEKDVSENLHRCASSRFHSSVRRPVQKSSFEVKALRRFDSLEPPVSFVKAKDPLKMERWV